MQFDTKIAIVIDEQLAVWQKANVTAFLISGIAGTDPELVGEPYVDGSGNRYLPMCRQPIMVYAADRPGLRRAYERAMARKVDRLAVFTHDLFATQHDEANREAVASSLRASSTSPASLSTPTERPSTKCSTGSAPTPDPAHARHSGPCGWVAPLIAQMLRRQFAATWDHLRRALETSRTRS